VFAAGRGVRELKAIVTFKLVVRGLTVVPLTRCVLAGPWLQLPALRVPSH